MICSICIATFKRPELLAKLLNSLYTQKLKEEISLEIIVVDNDINESAKSICNAFECTGKINLYYLTQSIQNISLTRNKAVIKATGEYLLFVDDDGYVCETWVSDMAGCIKEYNADAVFGAVIPYFEVGVPEWVRKGHFFEKGIVRTGEHPEIIYTTNCIVRSDLLKSLPEPFDPDLGLTGGEDGMLFGKLEKGGAKFVFCAEAIVYDFVPLDRGNLKYLAKRAFRIGITYTRAEIFFSDYKRVKRVYALFKGILYSFMSILLFILSLPSKLWRNFWCIKLTSNLGHLMGLFNIKYKMYKN